MVGQLATSLWQLRRWGRPLFVCLWSECSIEEHTPNKWREPNRFRYPARRHAGAHESANWNYLPVAPGGACDMSPAPVSSSLPAHPLNPAFQSSTIPSRSWEKLSICGRRERRCPVSDISWPMLRFRPLKALGGRSYHSHIGIFVRPQATRSSLVLQSHKLGTTTGQGPSNARSVRRPLSVRAFSLH